MADADRTLEILIKLGYVGADQADAARNALAGIKSETGDLNTSLPEGSELWAKYKNVLSDTSREAEGFSMRGREMHLIAAQLNQILPGLGLAFRGLTAAMGPFIVVALAIQTVTTYWRMYKDQVEATAKAQADALDEVREATHTAVEENSKFAKSLDAQRTASEQLTDQLDLQNAAIAGESKAQRELLAAQEKAEMAVAKTPEEKAGIRLKYEQLQTKAEEDARRERMANEDKAIADLKEKEDKLQFAREQNADLQAVASRDLDAAEVKRYQKIIDEETRQIDDLRRTRETLERKRTIEGVTAGAESSERRPTRAFSILSEFGGAEGLVGAVASNVQILEHGGKLSAAQIATNAAFTELMKLLGANGSQILELARLLAASQKNQAAEIAAIKNQLGNLPH